MNFASSFKPLGGLVLAAVAGLANATPVTDITFNSLQETFLTKLGSSYSEQGVTFSSANLWAEAGPLDADHSKTSGTLTEGLGLGTLTVTKSTAGTFDLASFQIADLLNIGVSSKVTMTYTDAAGHTHTETIPAIDTKSGLQTVTVNLDDITAFTLKDAFGFQLDNVRMTLNDPATTPAVPEPANAALLLSALGLLGFLARRRAK